jgi:hypothetical protein
MEKPECYAEWCESCWDCVETMESYARVLASFPDLRSCLNCVNLECMCQGHTLLACERWDPPFGWEYPKEE